MTAGLAVESLAVHYGATTVVDGLSFEAPRGRLTGLIGPNGAGKTTTFNACSGLLRPSAGRVLLDGQDITGLDPAGRARRGLGRTFQRMELFVSLTVEENVAVAVEAGIAGRSPLRQFASTAAERREVGQRVADALDVCGLTAVAARQAGSLSTGQRRMVELARAHAAQFGVLLLDEPSSGLDSRESVALGTIIRRWVDELDRGVLLVEHDMELVMTVCDHIYVLDFGRLIFEGSPTEVRRSDVVAAAYLGTGGAMDTDAEAVSA